MNTMRTQLIALAIGQTLLCTSLAGRCDAVLDPDNDLPDGGEGGYMSEVAGNPLADGDDLYFIRGFHRFFVGNLGVEASLSYAEPTSRFVDSLGGDAYLVLLDFSVVWYVNYHRYYNAAMERHRRGESWHANKRIKPEFIIFGGPGLASLKVDDAFPQFGLHDASRDYFTLNAGVGVKLHWMRTDSYLGLDHSTSRWYVRPEARARLIDNNVDWGLSIALGRTFGKRSSQRALELKVAMACDEMSASKTPLSEKKVWTAQELDQLDRKAREDRRDLEELKSRVVTCGKRCERFPSSCLDRGIEDINKTLTWLRQYGANEVD